MKKILTLLLIAIFGMIPIVNAETCENYYISNFAGNVKNQNLNIGTNTVDLTLQNNIDLGLNYDYYYIYLYNAITTSSHVNYSSIDYTSTCTYQTNYWAAPTNQPYIRYMDGSTANILNYQEIVNLCDTFSNSGSITSPISYEPTISNINVVLRNSNNGDQVICDYNKDNGIAKCPKSGEFNTIRFWVTLEKSNTSNFRVGVLSGSVRRCSSDTTSIINNQNQNAQQQHNDAQQQYNFISNTTIDTSTTDDVNYIDVSDTDTKNAVTNFALIPLNFMQSIINSFSSSCSQVCIGECGGSSGGGHDNAWRFIFPCLDIEGIVGSNIYAIIDSLFSFGMVFAFIRSVRKFFINALLLTTDASSEVGVFL